MEVSPRKIALLIANGNFADSNMPELPQATPSAWQGCCKVRIKGPNRQPLALSRAWRKEIRDDLDRAGVRFPDFATALECMGSG